MKSVPSQLPTAPSAVCRHGGSQQHGRRNGTGVRLTGKEPKIRQANARAMPRTSEAYVLVTVLSISCAFNLHNNTMTVSASSGCVTDNRKTVVTYN